jgi:hypothetical protein
MQDIIHGIVQPELPGNIVAYEPEAGVLDKVLDVTGVPGNEIVHAKNLHPFPDKTVAEMTS